MLIVSESLDKAKKFHKLGDINKAIKIYIELIEINKKNPEIFFLLGTAYLQKKNYNDSVQTLEKAIKLNKDIPLFYNNLGIAFSNLQQHTKAIKNYNKALEIKPDFLDANINIGVEYKIIKEFEKAEEYLRYSLKLSPKSHIIYNNLGNLFKDKGNLDDAIIFYNKAINLNKSFSEAYNNKAEIFLLKKNFEEAADNFKFTLESNKDFSYAFGKYIHSKMNICDWENYDKNLNQIINKIKSNKNIIEPFLILSLVDDLKIQKKVAEDYVKKFISNKSLKKLKSKNSFPKIAYFSPDFSDHPVLRLMEDTFKNHNKKEFEFYAFSFGLKSRNKSHYNIKKYFKEFKYIDNIYDNNVAKMCKDIGIDIAIDLCGHTAENRIGIFSNRVSDIQINYLGYPGSIGADFVDYIIADECIIPKKDRDKYTEKVLYLPNCYQSNPKKVIISNEYVKKSDYKLPENKFIFCSFNNHNKITPIIFKCWMKILSRSKDSVLWLYVTNDIARKNILIEASKNNVSSDRIIFASNIEHSKHLGRLKLADLFLDTFPYNAHTTGSDAFRLGLPIVTCAGNTFASRVSASILNSNDLGELVTKNLFDYENLAVTLSENKTKFNELKNKVKEKSVKSKLFDNIQFTKNLESIFRKIL